MESGHSAGPEMVLAALSQCTFFYYAGDEGLGDRRGVQRCWFCKDTLCTNDQTVDILETVQQGRHSNSCRGAVFSSAWEALVKVFRTRELEKGEGL